MNAYKSIFISVSLALLMGCSTTTHTSQNPQAKTKRKESPREAATALKSVAESLGQQELTQEDLRRLSKQIQKDEGTQTAVESITNALEGNKTVTKYCPLDGKRYSAHLDFCPGTDVPLEVVQ